MAIQLVFDVELVNELTGQTMDFQYEIEIAGYSKTDAEDYAERVESGDTAFADEVMGWLSVVPRLAYIDGDFDE